MRTDLGNAVRNLATMAKIGLDNDFVKEQGRKLAKSWKDTYIPKKDKELMRFLTPAEQAEFASI